MEPNVYCSTHELETGMNGTWGGVKKRKGLRSLHLGCGGMLDLPHNIRKVSKRVRLDLQSGGDLADRGSVCRKSSA